MTDTPPTPPTPPTLPPPRLGRRAVLGLGAAVVAGAIGFKVIRRNRGGGASARKPIRIGMTSDASGQYANHGEADRRGMTLAIEECNAQGGVLGRLVESLHLDTETQPASGSRVAERLIAREGCGFLIGATHSGVANAISQVAQRHGVIFLNTNSSSPSESGRDAHRTKFVWDGNGSNFGIATVRHAIATVGKRFMLLTNDYVWGHDTAKGYKANIAAGGGEVVKELLVPQNTRDFAPFLLDVQQTAPDVVAAAIGGDDQKVMRTQVVQLGLTAKPLWINNQQDWEDVYGLPPGGLFGVCSTTWYHKLPLPSVEAFVARYRARFPEARIPVPGNVCYNGYMATRELLRAIARAGTTHNHQVIRQLESLRVPALERMQHDEAWMNARTHHLQQTIYMVTENPSPADPTDRMRILGQITPQAAVDPLEDAAAMLEPFEATPEFEA